MMFRRDQGALPGSWRGAPPVVGGQGSMAGPKGASLTSSPSGTSGWTPTVANLIVLITLEIAAYVALRWAFRTAHGG
jgi:hypothetical protein